MSATETFSEVQLSVSPERLVLLDATPGESHRSYTERIESRQAVSMVYGRVLLLPRTRIVVVPFEMTAAGWNCAVISRGGAHYPEGTFPILVGDREIETAIELTVSAR